MEKTIKINLNIEVPSGTYTDIIKEVTKHLNQ